MLVCLKATAVEYYCAAYERALLNRNHLVLYDAHCVFDVEYNGIKLAYFQKLPKCLSVYLKATKAQYISSYRYFSNQKRMYTCIGVCHLR